MRVLLPFLFLAACGQVTRDDSEPPPAAVDTDGDGVVDADDGCPYDEGKTEPGLCGCSLPDVDTDADGTPDCQDLCPRDPNKIEKGVCGCGEAEVDTDADEVCDDVDVCLGHDDRVDSDADGIPDGCEGECVRDQDCASSQTCGTARCIDYSCLFEWNSTCDWPAESGTDAVNLTDIEGTIIDNDFYRDLSGAVWNPVSRTLWVCRNGGPSKLWAVVEDGDGSFEIAYRAGERAEWEDFGDLEAVTQADFSAVDTVFLLVEGAGLIQEWDFADYASPNLLHSWNVTGHVSGDGAEGLTFVPDEFLEADGFVDAGGNLAVSAGGMGGIMLVGQQNGGNLYAFDLDRSDDSSVFLGQFETAAAESAGLEFDRSTGQLYIWHDEDFDELEVARLSSSPVSAGRRLDTITVFSHFDWYNLASTNHEGIAIAPVTDCVDDGRSFFMTTDGGDLWSLTWFLQFPCF